ncbi:MAG: hypothetical protein EOS36_21285 [Mesorhizobium sp.]|uniref:hypothetical protein n=1 Tax=Mesorhizobium sp. TaxID=1871066 RepID=UPI000FE6BFBE|nr:hypothetical protein [Mesorhizobium sp.]RWD60381.1 MAG: hypothetical protein EOS36_21285 [Mesorhizobium sp.]RWE38481.1 MAG: hypothetical protein EOS79_23085 [Mesorhizobium sp.]
MISSLFRIGLAWLLLPWLCATALADATSFPELNNTVPGHQDVTYLELARMVIPDLSPGRNGFYDGTVPIEMRHISAGDDGGSPPATTSLSNAEVLAIRAAGKDRLAMLYDLGFGSDSAEGYAVLALYDLTGKPRLLDAVNVAVDRSTSFREPGKVSIAAGDDAIVTMSTHFNSNQGYAGTMLIMVRHDRFHLIDEIYTFDENYCPYRRTQNLAFRSLGGHKPYAPIKVTVTDATVPSEESCDQAPPKATSHDISVTYHWDKAKSRYVKNSDAFEKLSAENEKRF